jgi:hypothetical protein
VDANDSAIVEAVRKNHGEQALSYKACIRAVESGCERRVWEAAEMNKNMMKMYYGLLNQ